MLSLHESVYLERAIEQSESNLQEILQRLNELSLDLLSSSAEQSEEEGMNQAPPFISTPPSSSRICPIHQAGSKTTETCCTHCEVVNLFRKLSLDPCFTTCNADSLIYHCISRLILHFLYNSRWVIREMHTVSF